MRTRRVERTISGQFELAAELGTGFTAARISNPGVYDVKFHQPFRDQPVILVSPLHSSAYYAHVTARSSGGCTVNLRDAAGTLVNGSVAFTARGRAL